MKLFHWFAAAVIVGALSVLLVNCSSGPSCDASSCKTGCCTTNGLCQNGNTANACGSGGKACSLCTGSQVCTSGVCQNSSCTSNCGGNDSGNPDSGNPGGDAGNGQFAGYCNLNTVPCTGGLQCLTLGGNGGVCSSTCGDAGTNCTQGSCINFGNFSSCAETCSGTTCGTGDVCATFTGGSSICIPDCRIHSDLCGTGTVCDQSTGICMQSGTQMFGQPCGTAATGACNTGFSCIALTMTATQGFCSANCTMTPDTCATRTPAGACDLIQPDGGGLCGFPCTGADGGMSGTCPTGLTCQAAFGVFFCQ